VQNVSPLHEAEKGADFPKLDPDPLGVTGGVAKIKVEYMLQPSPPDGDSSGVHDLRLPLRFGSDVLFLCI